MSLSISRQHWQQLIDELEGARRQRQVVTYRALIERLQLPSPAMQTLAAALELLASRDARDGLPLRSALVVSQGITRLPREGFFLCAERLGRFSAESATPSSWHASEIARVFESEYPGEPDA